ncbi:MAG: M3 family oligoendopeptidase [Patescibacteria group bacterium]
MSKRKLATEWDMSILGKKIDDPQFTKERAKIKKIITDFVNTWSKDKSYLSRVSRLKQALEEYTNILEYPGNEGYYLQLRQALNSADISIKRALKKYEEFYIPLSNALSFFELSLAQIDKATQKKFLASKNLQAYHFYLKSIFDRAQYNLSQKEENLLTLLSGVSEGNWIDMQEEFLVNDTEVAWNEIEIKGKTKLIKEACTLPILLNNISHPKKKVRDSAADGVNAILRRQASVTEREINSVLERKRITDDKRGYTRPDQARHLADDIDSRTVDTMIDVVRKNFSIVHKYYKLKARILKQDSLAYHERNLSIGTSSQKFSYEEAVALVSKAYTNLDKEFAGYFDKFIIQGRIDVYPKKAKADGAFCAGASKTTPTYILLNYGNRLRDVQTIAHETGHGIHNELMRPSQGVLYCGTTLATAEVASTFCEDFTLEELLKEATTKERLVIMMQKMDDLVSTIFRQVAFYNFEQDLHTTARKYGYVSNTEIGALFQKHMKSYMGPAVSQDSGSENWWMYVGHFRRPFYVYTYASGQMISMALQQMVRKDAKAIDQVKQFMRAGTSKSTEAIFSEVGINIRDASFWESSISRIKELQKELESLAKELGYVENNDKN